MQQRTFGRTGLQVSILGLGSGGPSLLGQRTGKSREDVTKLVRTALDRGINLIDTAADYQDSETILGEALRGVPRESYVLCTKFSPARNNALKEPEALSASLDQSLRRLQTSYVDVFQLHGVTPEWYQPSTERFLPALQRAQQAGKTRFIGLTESFAADHAKVVLADALASDCWDTLMVGYNMLTQQPEQHALPVAARQHVGVLVMCAVRRALGRPELLAGVIRDLKQRGKIAPEALPDEGPLDWLLGPDVHSITDACYKYAAANPAVSCVLTGTASLDHLLANLAAIEGPPLAPEHVQRLQAVFGAVGENIGN